MTVESQPVIPSTTAILRRVQPPRSMTGRTAGYAPRAKNAACRLREHCFLHPQPAHPVLRSSSLLRDSTVTLVPINDNCEEKVWRRRHNARPVLKFTRPSMIHGRATKLLPWVGTVLRNRLTVAVIGRKRLPTPCPVVRKWKRVAQVPGRQRISPFRVPVSPIAHQSDRMMPPCP